MVHRCPSCPYTTTFASDLRKHVHTHTGEKPYACTQCGAASATICNLSRHGRIHRDHKPFSCRLCGQRFRRTDHAQTREAKCGRQRVKVKEERVLSFLESTGLGFQREVTVWFDRAQRHFARVDFVVPFEDRLVYVEVDEHQHAEYDQRKDLERTWRLFETCPKPLHLVRCNPDKFVVANQRRKFICPVAWTFF